MPGTTSDTSATYFFITDQRSLDRTQAVMAASSSASATDEARKLVYRQAKDSGASTSKRAR